MVFTAGALPAVHPVIYLLDDEEVIFRTAAGSKLAAATRHQIVGFQADEIDPLLPTQLRRPRLDYSRGRHCDLAGPPAMLVS